MEEDKREKNQGTSLAVQWLKLCTSNAGGEGWILVQGIKIPYTHYLPSPSKKKKKKPKRSGASLGAQMVKNFLAMWETYGCEFSPWVGKIPWRMAWLPTLVLSSEEFCGERSLALYSP